MDALDASVAVLHSVLLCSKLWPRRLAAAASTAPGRAGSQGPAHKRLQQLFHHFAAYQLTVFSITLCLSPTFSSPDLTWGCD